MSDNEDIQRSSQTASPSAYHVPVLLGQSVGGLNIRPGGVYVDVTFGGGGHTREILSRMDAAARLFAFDQDGEALANAPQDDRLTLVRSNFRFLANWMRYYGVEKIDGLLADLGVSSHHFDDEERGFSFRFDAPLDMRMNRQARLTAADVVNGYEETRLADVLYLFGELRNARQIARAIVRRRAEKPVETSAALIEATRECFRREREKKDLARLFQALRIEVNGELDALKELLDSAGTLLGPGGRLSVITYHSLEDRMVKNFIKAGNSEGRRQQDFYGRVETPFRAVNAKPIVPDEAETTNNPRSRSAKLRIAEKQ